MTTNAATATRYPCPCVASRTVKCTKHVRTVVTVDQAAELNSLFLAWHTFHSPDASEIDRRRALRAADLASTRVHQYDGLKLIFTYRPTGKRP